ncbi:Fur family ferric uptake transcriptional regulator [Sphaerotilus hippei]|uniref:Ferric uptake regulation protein n=1 Tax=Sphaerotilus hippei TaxID=744406 RepID=A0A318H843_9BURK|nr:transcriptional repressor [Sphaerotilus hippei]PXW98844.1 Fur family ferric uptake transcriptional regulator [Sphaerotilus hippei]
MERSTRQRSAIRDAITAAQRPLSPQEVLDAAKQQVPALGLATVYRNLKLLVDEGEVHAVTLPGDSPRYQPARHEHHHHFRCTGCHKVFVVHGCPGNLGHLVPPGFRLEQHDITLYGLCSDCAAA